MILCDRQHTAHTATIEPGEYGIPLVIVNGEQCEPYDCTGWYVADCTTEELTALYVAGFVAMVEDTDTDSIDY